MRKIILMAILAACLFQTRAALADAHLCNSTGKEIWATFGEQWFGDLGTKSGRDYIIGWYDIQTGQCATPIVGDVCNWWASVWEECSWAILLYADDAFGDQWGGWGSDTWEFICTTDNRFFEYPQYSEVNGNCPADRTWRFWDLWLYGQPNDDVTVTFD